jgi:meiotic recombination protein REC8
VYGEQCNFVLKDAQVEQNKIRTLLRSLHAAPIELDGKHKVKYIFSTF